MRLAVCVLFVVCMVLVVDRAYIHHLLNEQSHGINYIHDVVVKGIKDRVTTNEEFSEIYRERIFN